jgi:hypothetical protein
MMARPEHLPEMQTVNPTTGYRMEISTFTRPPKGSVCTLWCETPQSRVSWSSEIEEVCIGFKRHIGRWLDSKTFVKTFTLGQELKRWVGVSWMTKRARDGLGFWTGSQAQPSTFQGIDAQSSFVIGYRQTYCAIHMDSHFWDPPWGLVRTPEFWSQPWLQIWFQCWVGETVKEKSCILLADGSENQFSLHRGLFDNSYQNLLCVCLLFQQFNF